MHKQAKKQGGAGKTEGSESGDDQNMFEDLGGAGGSDSDGDAMDLGGAENGAASGNAKKRGGDREYKSKGKVHKDKMLNKRTQKEAKKSKKLNQQKGIIKTPAKPK